MSVSPLEVVKHSPDAAEVGPRLIYDHDCHQSKGSPNIGRGNSIYEKQLIISYRYFYRLSGLTATVTARAA